MTKHTTETVAEPSSSAADERLKELQSNRRALEVELSTIDERIRAAIDTGDLKSLDELTVRKSELPKLFVAASTAETSARREVFNAQDEVNLSALETANLQRDKIKAAYEKRQVEVEKELAELKEQLADAEAKVKALYSTIQASRDLGAAGEAGFKRSLAAVAL